MINIDEIKAAVPLSAVTRLEKGHGGDLERVSEPDCSPERALTFRIRNSNNEGLTKWHNEEHR